MTKDYCDICHVELSDHIITHKSEVAFYIPRPFRMSDPMIFWRLPPFKNEATLDVCKKCYDDLKEWIRVKRLESRDDVEEVTNEL